MKLEIRRNDLNGARACMGDSTGVPMLVSLMMTCPAARATCTPIGRRAAGGKSWRHRSGVARL